LRLSGLQEGAWQTPPDPEEAEVSVFGPGEGESLVVHLGDGEWMIVDSCKDLDTGHAVAIDYLTAIGVDIGSKVSVIVATHWHDDHIKGLAEIVKMAEAATFFCPAALKTQDFLYLVQAYGRRTMMSLPSTAEFEQILETMALRRSKRQAPNVQTVVAHTIVWRNGALKRVEALSPSQTAVQRGLVEIASLVAAIGPKAKLTSRSANENSIVLLSVVEGARALLGGDLQEEETPVAGWSEILSSPQRCPERANLFKAAHHGADNADHPAIWSDLLLPEASVGVTSYAGGVRPRPESADINRIVGQAGEAYLTSAPVAPRSARREPSAERLLRHRAHRVEELERRMGHIRFRRIISSDETARWSVELFGGAKVLATVPDVPTRPRKARRGAR